MPTRGCLAHALSLAATCVVAGAMRAAAAAPESAPTSFTIPVIGADGSGNVVVVGERQDGDASGIGARRLDASGAPLGGDIVVNTYTTGAQRLGAVAVSGSGTFVVVWTRAFAELAARRFDADGAPLGDEFLVNETQPAGPDIPGPQVAMDSSGGFVVAWRNQGSNASSDDVFARRYDDTGAPAGADFQVNTTAVPYQAGHAALAFDPADNFVVVWSGTVGGVTARRYDAAGSPLGAEFQVSGGYYPIVATTPAGFVLVWDDTTGALHGQRYDTSGVATGAEMALSGVHGFDFEVAVDAGGRMLVSYRDVGPQFRPIRAMARLFAADGTPIGESFALAAFPRTYENFIAVARGGPDDFLAAWNSRSRLSEEGVALLRRITPGRIHGKQCQVSIAGATARRIRCEAYERSSPTGVAGDPAGTGATLRFVTEGGTATDQTFVLPPGAAWQVLTGFRAGFVYRDPNGVAGPVRLLSLKKAGGRLALKASVSGTPATPPPGVQAVPPDPGVAMALVLDIGGHTYCTGFGAGQGGGLERRNDARAFRIRRPISDGACP